MSEGRNRAERSVDALSAEARKLRALRHPSNRQRARLYEIEAVKLPAAWRAVRALRGA